MNLLKIALFTLVLAVSYDLNLADDEPQAPQTKRIALRRPVGKIVKSTTTTTTTPPADNEDGDYNEENQETQYSDEGEELLSSTTTTTTESPKKVGPVIRPFRSNNDFLNSLKRRQMNAKKNKPEKVTIKPNKLAQEQESGNDAEDSAPLTTQITTKNYKPNNSALNRRKYSKPNKTENLGEEFTAEESEQQQKEEAKPRRPIGRLALRKQLTK